MRRLILWVACVLAVAVSDAANAQQNPETGKREAKKAFGSVREPVPVEPQVFGRYERGCVAGAQRLSVNGPGWQTMRLSRNRFWGHPLLIAYIQRLASDVNRLDGLPGILVGDMAQPIGGPLLGGHASHQTGLDVDLWYTLMPGQTLSPGERERLAATNVVDQASLTVDPGKWTEAQAKLVRRAASYPEVARIFVHPAIKKALCESAGRDRAWLIKVRPWYRHDDHFHVRLNCPPDSPACAPQAAVEANDGCGAELDEWFKKLRAPPPIPPKEPPPKPKPMLVSALPQACQALLEQAESRANSGAQPN